MSKEVWIKVTAIAHTPAERNRIVDAIRRLQGEHEIWIDEEVDLEDAIAQ